MDLTHKLLPGDAVNIHVVQLSAVSNITSVSVNRSETLNKNRQECASDGQNGSRMMKMCIR